MQHPGRPTLAAVAARAGVSIATASRALSGASASARTQDRVRRAADELGYATDSLARSLKVGRTDQLVMAVADLSNPSYAQMMRAVESVAKAAGYRLVLAATGNTAEGVGELVRSMRGGYADGLLAAPLRYSPALVADLIGAPFPVALLGTPPPGTALDTVRANSPRGMSLVVDHLRDAGRRDVVLINGPADTTAGANRLRGFRRAVRRLGLAAREVAAADFTVEAGEKAALALLAGDAPDALVCANDLLAVGALRATRSLGFDVPGTMAVTGIDNTDLADVLGLTSVDLGGSERAALAAGMLLDRLREPGRAPASATVQPRLVERASSGSAGAGPRAGALLMDGDRS